MAVLYHRRAVDKSLVSLAHQQVKTNQPLAQLTTIQRSLSHYSEVQLLSLVVSSVLHHHPQGVVSLGLSPQAAVVYSVRRHPLAALCLEMQMLAHHYLVALGQRLPNHLLIKLTRVMMTTRMKLKTTVRNRPQSTPAILPLKQSSFRPPRAKQPNPVPTLSCLR